MIRGVWKHFALTLALNLRSPQALVYGYAVPVFFLLAFGSVFSADTPPLTPRLGQLLTITLLGGACFGLPTALVAERERGVWRRYRLLPVGTGPLLGSVLAARVAMLGSAVALQLALARWVYGTPWPEHPWLLAGALLFVLGALLGLGLLVAALANDVPAVQALGQCLFLPMIMIGGVGIPLAVLPVWAQRVAGFMPGRYAVEVLQAAVNGPQGLAGFGFHLGALGVIGVAAGAAGVRWFRWDAGRGGARGGRGGRGWIALALLAWVGVGGAALGLGKLKPVLPAAEAWATIADETIARVTYDDLPTDAEFVTRLSPPFAGGAPAGFAAEFARKLDGWRPGRGDDAGQSIRFLVAVAAIADLCQHPQEGEIARCVFDRMLAQYEPEDVRRALAWIVLAPDEGKVVRQAPELGLPRHPPERVIRQRSVIYAQKYLGRLTGKIRD